MKSKVGEKYFDLRARLGAGLYALAEVATAAGMPSGRAQLLHQLIGSLKSPFLFVVAGEVNAGKSTFLNAMFGEEFCPTAVLPTTDRIHLFQYGKESRDVVVNEQFVELYRDRDFLRDFHIVDTPGTNSVATGHHEITERFLPMADLVIFVFSTSNPWGASTWEFIEQIYEGWLKQVVFVLQQTDLRTAEEVHAIVEHMDVVAKERFGRTFPVFPVSGKQALTAKLSVHGDEEMLLASGFPALERHISEIIVSTPAAERKLRNILNAARAIAKEVRAHLEPMGASLQVDHQVIGELDSAIQEDSAHTLEKLRTVQELVHDQFDEIIAKLAKELRKETGIVATFTGSPGTVAELEEELKSNIGELAKAAAMNEAQVIEREMPGLWERVVRIVRPHFRVDLQAFDGSTESAEPNRPVWLDARRGLARDLHTRFEEALTDTDTVQRLDNQISESRNTVRASLTGMFVAAMAAVFGWLFQIEALLLVAGSLAILVAVLVPVLAAFKRKTVIATFQERMERARKSTQRELAEVQPLHLKRYINRLSARLDPVREFCRSQRHRFQPLFHDLEQLDENFSKIESELSDIN